MTASPMGPTGGQVDVRVTNHPLIAVRLTELRAAATPPPRFRALLEDLATLLAYDATRALPTRPVTVRTPVADAAGVALDRPPLLVPVLRAGLGLLPAFARLLPEAPIAMVGLGRDEVTLQPTWYLNRLPERLAGRPVLVLDPMLATGGTLVAVLAELARRGAGPVVVVAVLAAPPGLDAVREGSGDLPAVTVVTAAVDDRLDEHGWIVPGLGDAGDRQNAGDGDRPAATTS